jgi:hypothetical protein
MGGIRRGLILVLLVLLIPIVFAGGNNLSISFNTTDGRLIRGDEVTFIFSVYDNTSGIPDDTAACEIMVNSGLPGLKPMVWDPVNEVFKYNYSNFQVEVVS